MRLVDLTRPLDARDIGRLPKAMLRSASALVPSIEHITPQGAGADAMCRSFGCTREDLPDGEGWGEEVVTLSSHLGTHVDAPSHYGTTCEGKRARTIGDISLDELYCEGIVLNLQGKCERGKGIEVDALREALAQVDAEVRPGSAVLLRTGQEAYDLSDPDFFTYPGMTRAGTLFLAELGAKVLGTDALGWDRPFREIRRAFAATGERSEIWDGHLAGREREVFIVQQLENLALIPSSGFKVGCFPMRLTRCSASPARVVAFVS